ncbi:GNAT family N-acetyltransferase [Candidatus Bathyarchaeota archaeon]|nr:MAG: GNAT family N-acetyltransferase [Candidatus Bathyarchaeota archaeon]
MTIILILLAEVKGEIVGFAHAEVQYRTTHIPAIIGSRLVQEICRFFRRKNVEDIYLRYVLGNKEGEKFWEKLGFKPILVTAHSRIDIVEKRSQTAS